MDEGKKKEECDADFEIMILRFGILLFIIRVKKSSMD